MNPGEFKALSRWFDVYVRPFADRRGRLEPVLQIKLDHSRRVAAIMELLARDMEQSPAETRLARALGLLHDVGRFSQFARYRTLNDRISIDHGLRGVEVLAQVRPLAACSPEDRRRILAGVRHHNSYRIPARIVPGVRRAVQLIRDADKLDVIRTIMGAWASGEVRRQPELVFNLKLDGRLNPAAVADLRAGRTVAYRHLQSVQDFFLVFLSWVYDLNFGVTYRRLAAWNLVEIIVGALPSDAALRKTIGWAVRHFERQQRRRD